MQDLEQYGDPYDYDTTTRIALHGSDFVGDKSYTTPNYIRSTDPVLIDDGFVTGGPSYSHIETLIIHQELLK